MEEACALLANVSRGACNKIYEGPLFQHLGSRLKFEQFINFRVFRLLVQPCRPPARAFSFNRDALDVLLILLSRSLPLALSFFRPSPFVRAPFFIDWKLSLAQCRDHAINSIIYEKFSLAKYVQSTLVSDK